MDPLPRVTTLMAAHDAERFVEQAVRSALDQDYPAERLDVIVVDDGSADATAAVVRRVADAHPGRVRLIRQDNAGQAAAITRAAQEADGELLAMLDADDLWPRDKIRRQVELLQARPEVGLVYGDMCVIDAAGRVLEESWLAGARPPQGREIGPLLEQNLVTGSSIVLRAALRDALFPIPAEMPWSDWWLAVRAAQVAELAYLPEPRTLYRFHGANMTLGAQGAERLRELRKSLRLQRWFLRRLEVPATSIADLECAWDGFARVATEALEVAGSPFVALVEVGDDDRAAARAGGARARELLAAGALHAALGAAVAAAAADPLCDEVRATLLEVRAAIPGGAGQQPLRDARAFVVCVAADELAREPALLAACAEHLGDLSQVTVAIDASTVDPAVAERSVRALVAEHGLADAPLDLLLVSAPLDELGRARLARGTHARLGVRRGDGDADVPAFAAAELAALRELVLARSAAPEAA